MSETGRSLDTPRELLAALIDAFERADFQGAATDAPEGARWAKFSATLIHMIISRGRATLATPQVLPDAFDLSLLPIEEMTKCGWVRFVDGPDSRARARDLISRWYSTKLGDVKISGEALEDLELRMAAQMDVERMIWTQVAAKVQEEDQST